MGINLNKNNFINKPTYLQKNRLNKKNQNEPLNNTVNFKGLFNPNSANKIINSVLPPKITSIPVALETKALKLLKRESDNLAELYTGFKDTFIERVKTSDRFCRKLGIDEKTLEHVKNGTVIEIPQTNLAKKFVSNIFAPLRVFSDLYSYGLNSKVGKWAAKKSNIIASLAQRNAENVKDAEIIKNYRSYTGLIGSIKIWEAKQRKIAGLSAWNNSKDLRISTKVLESKAMRRWLKSVDPTKGKYQTKHQMLGNRLISGLIYGTFLGNDAYNTTIRYSNDEKEAKSQRRSRFAQELAKIGINMYLINLMVGTFERYVNKNLFHALFIAGATSMSAEILGRKLVGRPIFPSDKETLDEMNKKMENKKGFWVAVGRLISGTKAKPNNSNSKNNISSTRPKLMVLSPQRILPSNGQEITLQKDNKVKSPLSFQGKKSGQISFGSFYKVKNYMSTKKVSSLLDLLEKADPKIHQTFVGIINKSLSKNTNGAKDLKTVLSKEEFIPIGTKKTLHGNLVKSVAAPFFFIKNSGQKIVSGIRKMFHDSSTVSSLEEMKEQLRSMKSKNPEIEKQYKEFLDKVLNSKMWKVSKLDGKTKETKLLSEFLEAAKKDTEEIEGVKNILLFLDKHMKSKDITSENVENIKDLLYKNFMKTDGAAHVEYDGNTFAMMNINLSRIITTLFLVVDAYNLSMQYSNNDKNTAINNGKSRALQEASRITVSAYMLAFVHNLLSKFCNSSLFGAFATTALTSSVNDTIARKAVGVPIGAKTYDELVEIDKENAKSKSPLKRTLAYLVGKKQKNQVPESSKSENEIENNNYGFSLSITKSFASMLNDK